MGLLNRVHLNQPEPQGTPEPSTATVSIEQATLFARLHVEHLAVMLGHDPMSWSFDENGVATTYCQLCGRTAEVYYRALLDPTYVHDFQEPCPAAS